MFDLHKRKGNYLWFDNLDDPRIDLIMLLENFPY